MLKVKVRLPDGQEIPLAVVERDHASRKLYLERYHGNAGDILCMCRHEGVPMGVGRRQVPVTVYYFYPLHRSDPARHALGCPHHAPEQTTADVAKAVPVIQVEDGKIRVNLASPLYRGQPAVGRGAGEDVKEDEPRDTRKAPPRGRLLTLLEVLWSEAELNMWSPWFEGKRHYNVVAYRLKQAAADIQVRQRDLLPLLHIPPKYTPDQEKARQQEREAFLEALREKDGKSYYGYVLGLFRDVVPGKAEAVGIRISQSPLRLWMPKTAWHRAVHRWFHDDQPQQHAAVMFRVSRRDGKQRPWLAVEDMAVMPLSDDTSYIPVASEYERRLVKKLVAESRRFRKPLSYEAATDELLPDLILEDRQDRLYLEVLGRMTDPEYRARVVEKRARYEQMKQPVWWWDTESEPEIPPLPAPDRMVSRVSSLTVSQNTAPQAAVADRPQDFEQA
jgi:hypothetical protein